MSFVCNNQIKVHMYSLLHQTFTDFLYFNFIYCIQVVPSANCNICIDITIMFLYFVHCI